MDESADDLMTRKTQLVNWQDDIAHTLESFAQEAIRTGLWPEAARTWSPDETARQIEIMSAEVYDFRAAKILADRGLPASQVETFRQQSCRHPGYDPIYFEDWLDHLPDQLKV